MKLNEAINLIKDKIEGRQYGKEVVGLCPYCNSKDKKFYVNVDTGQFSCKKGSCNSKGNAISLFKHLGINETIEYEDYESPVVKKVNDFKYDSSHIEPISDDNSAVIDYMMSRGISVDTLREAGVEYSTKHNAMVFKTFVSGEVKSVQYRTTDKRLFMERGSSQNLWGMEKLNFNNKTIYITEGVPDCLTLREMGIENAVSMPNGCANHSWIDSDWDTLNKFEKIVLCYDNDAPGRKGLSEVRSRLDFATLYELDYGIYKDVNDMFMGDSEALYKTIRTPKEIAMDGFISLQNVSTETGVIDTLMSTGLKQLDRIFGGIGLHQSTIICSESGAGKSTMISNMIKGILYNGEKTAVWSGELSNKSLKVWLYSTIGGEKAIDYKEHPFRENEFISSIKPEYEKRIDKAVDGKLFVYDGNKSDGHKMIKHFEYLHKRHGVKYFFIDNLSILDMSVKGLGQYEAESEFSKAVASFTRNNAVHLFLVAHPTKSAINADPNFIDAKGRVKAIERYTQQQVRGSATLVNLIHNVLFLCRAKEHEKAFMAQQAEQQLTRLGKTKDIPALTRLIMEEFSLLAYLVKNRSQGNILENSLMGYDSKTRRIYGLHTKESDLSVELIKDNDVVEITEEEYFEYSDF